MRIFSVYLVIWLALLLPSATFAQTSAERKAQAVTEALLEEKVRSEQAAIEKAKRDLILSSDSGPSFFKSGLWTAIVIVGVIFLSLLLWMMRLVEPDKKEERPVVQADVDEWARKFLPRFTVLADDHPNVKKLKKDKVQWFKDFSKEILSGENDILFPEADEVVWKNMNFAFKNDGTPSYPSASNSVKK